MKATRRLNQSKRLGLPKASSHGGNAGVIPTILRSLRPNFTEANQAFIERPMKCCQGQKQILLNQ
ncbi:hypothetical protein EV05_1096 [Prochlorococcus sp. MIT 0601]|nr:hypothetical protein EV05_1096 [Prochlorococcus sp. MIT 0601]